MDISVIVAVYKGEKYIANIQCMVKRNMLFAQKMGLDISVELILVNDYPGSIISVSNCELYSVTVIQNNANLGIHATRVSGLLKAKGKYIIFLDQDDVITDNCFFSQYFLTERGDVVVGNGYRLINGKYRKIYNNILKQKLTTKEKYYLKAANQIVSPGHCLIKKESIPKEWFENIIEINGADDLFLWISMLEKRAKFIINTDCVYKHVDTGCNLSHDHLQMYNSAERIVDYIRKSKTLKEKNIAILARRISFLKKLVNANHLEKIILCMWNLDICVCKLYAYYLGRIRVFNKL
jgi:glycosyltransferase involved in cell wall biosynthesis